MDYTETATLVAVTGTGTMTETEVNPRLPSSSRDLVRPANI
jgi:hypothetical protein